MPDEPHGAGYPRRRGGRNDSISFLLDNAILVLRRQRQSHHVSTRASLKTFRLDGQWMVARRLRHPEDGRGQVLKMDWSEDVKVTNSAAVARINANDS